jgi:hypothetical protein
MRIFRKTNEENAFIIPAILSIMVALSIITGAVVLLIDSNFSLVGRNIKSQQAFNVAEAGLNYYLWHLSHTPSDYRDGQSTPITPDPTLGYGPYVHTYIDDQQINEGTFTLYINPAVNGSSVVKVRSIGTVAGSTTTRTIDAQIGAPSFASYAVVSDAALWFGKTESSNGPVQSNQGVRMDGASNDYITSPNATYIPPFSYGGCAGSNCSHPGVWCDTTVTAPVNCNTRNKSDWVYGGQVNGNSIQTINFNQVSTALCTIKKLAFSADSSTSALASQANACTQTPTTRTAAYLPQRASNGSFSLSKGYLIKLNNNGTYDLWQVNAENDQLTPYTSALTLASVATNITVPTSGVIFAEDNVWVMSDPSSSYHGRVTIAAGRLATASNADIVIAGNLKYSTKSGADAIGLIAEDSVIVAPYAPPSSGSFTFEVDGALLAQSGAVVYPDVYRVNGNSCTRGWTNSNQLLNFYGSIASRQNWTWTIDWGGSQCGDNVKDTGSGDYISGILNNSTQYDYNLQFNPPPSYPITSSYNILSWHEVLVIP